MKIRLLFTILVFSTLAWSQDSLIPIPGSKCKLIPPDGFILSKNFSGFENPLTGSSIMLVEIPSSYYDIAESLTAENLLSTGMTLKSKEPVIIDSMKAIYLTVMQSFNDIEYEKQIIVFGDSLKTIMINAIYPTIHSSIYTQIKSALFSIKYEGEREIKGEDVVKFSIDISNTKFKYAGLFSGSLIYTTDGTVPTSSPDNAMFVTGNSYGIVDVADRKNYALTRIKNLPNGESNKVLEINEVKLDGLPGYELVAEGRDKLNDVQLVYQVMIFDENSQYYILVGTCTADYQTYLPMFRTIAQTFRVK